MNTRRIFLEFFFGCTCIKNYHLFFYKLNSHINLAESAYLDVLGCAPFHIL
jgi:hypothetical protein